MRLPLSTIVASSWNGDNWQRGTKQMTGRRFAFLYMHPSNLKSNHRDISCKISLNGKKVSGFQRVTLTLLGANLDLLGANFDFLRGKIFFLTSKPIFLGEDCGSPGRISNL
jgi:hypothetical protein